jgi:isoprenylcysteine carboxyl methyltransferase (ICMT) family protein YpbQ
MAALVAQLPALPLHEAGKYVAGAYITLLVLVLVYVAVMALRVGRIERELDELSESSRRAGHAEGEPSRSESARA